MIVYRLEVGELEIYCTETDELLDLIKFEIAGLGSAGETRQMKITQLEMTPAEFDALPEVEI